MRRSWWIISFAGGLAVCVILVGRVLMGSYEIPSTRVVKVMERIDRDIAEKKIELDASLPLSQRYGALAADLRKQLDSGNVHERNKRAFEYLASWSALKSTLQDLKDAMGKPGEAGDPRPQRYRDAWLSIMAEVSRTSSDGELAIDLPRMDREGDQKRVYTIIGDHRFTKEYPVDVSRALHLVTDADGMINAADAEALRTIGLMPVRADAAKGTDAQAPANAVIGVRLDHVRDFLENRLALHRMLDETNVAMARRLLDLEHPEYAWSHNRVLYEDMTLGGGFSLRSMLGGVLDARRQHLDALAAFASDPEKPKNRQAYLDAQTEYRERLARYTSELEAAGANLLRIADGLDRLRDSYTAQLRAIDDEITRIGEYDETAFKELLLSLGSDAAVAEGSATYRTEDFARMLNELREERNVKLGTMRLALDAIDRFWTHLKTATGDVDDRDQLSARSLEALLLSSPALKRDVLSVPIEGTKQRPPLSADEYRKYLDALRDVALIDLKVLRARVARQMPTLRAPVDGVVEDVTASQVTLRGDDGNLYTRGLREAATVTVGQRVKKAEPLTRDAEQLVESELSALHNGFETIYKALGVQVNGRTGAAAQLGSAPFVFLERAIKAASDAAIGTPTARMGERDYFIRVMEELRGARSALIDAEFELAESHHRRAADKLAELTGPERPNVDPLTAYNYYTRHYRKWLEKAQRGDADPARPPEPQDPEFVGLMHYMKMEREYRKLRQTAASFYETFLTVEDDAVRRRANYGLVALAMDDALYTFDWKRRLGYDVVVDRASSSWQEDATKSLREETADKCYGTFAFVEGLAPGLERSDGVTTADGYWLSPQDARLRFEREPSDKTFDAVNRRLVPLRQLTPAQDPHLYVAIQVRSGQLKEMMRTRREFTSNNDIMPYLSTYHPGDLPGAVEEYYLPLLTDRNAVSDESLVRNKYVPLRDHFARVRDKLRLWMDVHEVGEPNAYQALFAALTPGDTAGASAEERISDFYHAYYDAVARREPGLVALQDALFDFDFKLGELSGLRSRLLLNEAGDSAQRLAEARRVEMLSKRFFRSAGKTMQEYCANFPDAPGDADRQIRIGDAYFRSDDHVFAITAYRKYFDARRLADRRGERAELFYVANRIGLSYLELGVYEGQKKRAAQAAGDMDTVANESNEATMSIDGALPAFTWAVQRTRQLLQGTGDSGRPINRIPPVGGLEAFVNLARTRIELGRVRAGAGDTEGEKLFETAAADLRKDLIEGGLFAAPPVRFAESMHWRDAQFYIGMANLELARRLRAAPPDKFDDARFKMYLDDARRAFDDIIMRWPNPVERRFYERAIDKGEGVAAALASSEQTGAQFTDDAFYLSILRRAEIEWLRATHAANPMSDAVIGALSETAPRLELLCQKLDHPQMRSRVPEKVEFGFPLLLRQSRYMLGDTLYLHARTLRDRMAAGDGNVRAIEVQTMYKKAISAYQDAIDKDPQTYLAAWAYAQILNAHRAMAADDTEAAKEERRTLTRARTFLASLRDDAFTAAPADMNRAAWENHFRWYDTVDNRN